MKVVAKEVDKYCLNDEMYVIINIHWDNGWWGMFGDVNKKTVYLLNRGHTVFFVFLDIKFFTILIKVYMYIKLKCFYFIYSGVTSLPMPESSFLSLSMVEPDVVSIFPVIVALAPPENAASPSFVISARPAARRTFASGFICHFLRAVQDFQAVCRGLASKR